MRNASFILLGLFLLLVAGACREEKKVDVLKGLNPAKMATMTTHNISTLISDSGVVQYRIVAPVWQVFDEVDTPYWSFPKGIYLRKYDRNFMVIATVAADSAIFLKNEKLWRLEGNVEMTKVPKDLFLSPRIFWDQRQGKIYSDTFMHIENATHMIEGDGFISDEKLTTYRIIRPTGVFPVQEL